MANKIQDMPAIAYNGEEVVLTVPEFVANEQRQVVVKKSCMRVFSRRSMGLQKGKNL